MLATSVLSEFELHAARLRDASRDRRAGVAARNLVDANEVVESSDPFANLGKRISGDSYAGDVCRRTLHSLLAIVDDRGWERSEHQRQFHDAFERCVARVIYKSEWSTSRPQIMQRCGWEKCSSEVLISTPRRFGKTFRRSPHAAYHRCHPLPLCDRRAASPSSSPVLRWPRAVRWSCFLPPVALPESFWSVSSSS